MERAEDRVKAKAHELGFSLVGIASAGLLREEEVRLQEWLRRGYQASMAWMERRAQERVDPNAVLPGARSVVCVAVNYFTPHAHANDERRGKVSRYAWGDDYHRLVGERLERLRDWMQNEFPGTETTWYVDTGPVLEKAWAQRAGIGWQGKHSNIITQELGSWVFLGELITTLHLEPDPPATDHCGTCTLCIEACPTGAIVEPYVVDSRACLSYLTIEHRSGISGDITAKFDGWIYGCDICQDVCPWNTKFAREASEPAFVPRDDHAEPLLEEWSRMTREDFTRKFTQSPIKRAKWDGLMRSIGIVRRSRSSSPDA